MEFLIFIWATFLVGIFSFGGGKAYIPIFQNIYVDQFNIISNFQLTELVTYAVTLPGPIAPMITGPVGFDLFSVWGFFIGLIVLTMPPFFLFVGIWQLYKNHSEKKKVKVMAKYLSPAIIALLLSVCFTLFWGIRQPQNYSYDFYFITIFLVSSAILIKTKVHPILLIIISGFIGYFVI
ncbi:MAG: chromate transporter [Alphaproteobacteria bacterium]|jgi:chromate transporter|nr:chromate transporter [Alphaproteobacteria bacterium]